MTVNFRRTCAGRVRVRFATQRHASRRTDLEAQLAIADEPPPLLHPSMADLYRAKVEELAAALQHENSRLEASETLRGLIDAIVLIPEGNLPPSRDGDESRSGEPRRSSKSRGGLRIELKGNLAAMLAAAQKTKRSPETGDLLVPIQVVAGGGI